MTKTEIPTFNNRNLYKRGNTLYKRFNSEGMICIISKNYFTLITLLHSDNSNHRKKHK